MTNLIGLLTVSPVLDKGYLGLVEAWGSDERVVESARMSTARGFEGWGGAPCPDCHAAGRLTERGAFIGVFEETAAETCKCRGTGRVQGDERLLRFLWENRHQTPFEMCGMTIEVWAPIMVFREWHRHRTQSYNEMSARFIPLPDEDYMPDVKRLMIDGGGNKQAGPMRGADPLTLAEATAWLDALEELQRHAQEVYARGLSVGVPKEIARLATLVSRYSKMRASANLRNWLGFLSLRMAPGAQWEIRQCANAVGEIVAARFPRTWDLFSEVRS